MDSKNNILGFKKQELELLSKSKSMSNQSKYLKWFIDNAEHFTDLNVDLSHSVSTDNDCQVKSCYHNCWKAVSYANILNLRYFEGYVYSERVPIPLEHSWLVTPEGQVVDPTLIITGEKAYKQMKKQYHNISRSDFKTTERKYGDEYFGVEFPLLYLNKLVMKIKRTGGFLIELFLSKNEKEMIVNGK